MKILIVRTDRIGDVVLTIPMISMIKKFESKSQISVMVRKYTSELFMGNNEIENCIVFDSENDSYWKKLKTIRKYRFEYVFVVSPSFKLALLFFLARIPYRIGTGYRWYSFLFNKRVFQHRKYAEKHELEFNLDLLKRAGFKVDDDIVFNIPIQQSDIDKVNSDLKILGISPNDKIVIIHPGSGKSAIDLPQEKYIELINLITYNKNLKILLTGGKTEFELVENILQKTGNRCFTMVDKLNLRELACLIKRSTLFISNSTGPIHIAAAVKTPVVGFYPPIVACSEKRWGPYTENKIIFVPEKEPYCKKCDKKAGDSCMNKISMSEVYEKIKHFFN